MYTEQDLVSIAKRENNNKRTYLVVNKCQGKHIPVSPHRAMDLFKELGEMLANVYKNETLLLIGFAETATAIGAAVSVQLGSYYMQTTREIIPDVQYFFFSEAHSHATEQKLVKDDLDKIIGQIDRIVFVEDEVTTGNTIFNIITLLRESYGCKLKFGVASILNGMNETDRKKYEKEKIPLHYLVKTNHDTYTEIAKHYRGDGKYYRCVCEDIEDKATDTEQINVRQAYVNARRLTNGGDYRKACEKLWEQIRNLRDKTAKNILVLGTEEFMYPALYVAEKMEDGTAKVSFHATTRSPITVSSEPDYPLHERYGLCSLYDKERVTYIYDLKKYDEVYIITDAPLAESCGLFSLIHALKQKENEKFMIVRWMGEKHENFLQ